MRLRRCWYFPVVISYVFCAFVESFIFPDDWEKIKSENEIEILEHQEEYESSNDTEAAPVAPFEEPSLSVDDAEQILDEIGFIAAEDEGNLFQTRFGGADSRILQYQQQYGLSETGILDRDTKISLKSPKCGISNVAAHGEDFKWSVPSLTYYVRNTPEGIDPTTVKQIIRNAFYQWSKVANLDFVESEDPEADFEIVFGGRKHFDREKNCRNVLGDTTLAHAFYPQMGAIHFNTKFFPGNMDKDEFFTTAMHEIGHALGLEHSVSKASLMFPTPVARFSEVPEPDVEKIQLKYGKRESLVTTSVPKFCDLPKFDAAMYRRGKLHIIAGKYCYSKFKPIEDPILLSNIWPGAPDSLDAAVTIGAETYFFKGDQVWAFKNDSLQIGYPRRIRDTFPGLPRNLDAVAYDGRRRHIYAFKNDHYWRYSSRQKTVDLSDEVADFGIAGKIDVAFIRNRDIHFFKDNVRHVHSLVTNETKRYDTRMFC